MSNESRRRSSFDDSVMRQVPALVPWGIQLSGGVDSSYLALLARSAWPKPKCYFVRFPNSPRIIEERNVAEIASLGLEIETLNLTNELFWHHFDEAQMALHSPMIDSAFIPQSLVAERARQTGLKVLWTERQGIRPRYKTSIRPVNSIFNFFNLPTNNNDSARVSSQFTTLFSI